MQVSRPLSAWMRDTSLHGRIHGVSALCMLLTCSTIWRGYLGDLPGEQIKGIEWALARIDIEGGLRRRRLGARSVVHAWRFNHIKLPT